MGKAKTSKAVVKHAAVASQSKQRTRPWARHSTLQSELQDVGLRIKEMAPDGNCFFRAVADQVSGNAGSHPDIRARVVAHMKEHAESYAPFVEDDEGFDKYVARMGRDAVWAGQMEVQAASECLACNIYIYQQGQPCWRVITHTPAEVYPCLHLSYHDGDHYNSVRLANDYGDGKPELINLAECVVDSLEGSDIEHEAVYGEREVKIVRENTYCFDDSKVHQALQSCGGDTDKAVEWLVESMAAEGVSTKADIVENSAALQQVAGSSVQRDRAECAATISASAHGAARASEHQIDQAAMPSCHKGSEDAADVILPCSLKLRSTQPSQQQRQQPVSLSILVCDAHDISKGSTDTVCIELVPREPEGGPSRERHGDAAGDADVHAVADASASSVKQRGTSRKARGKQAQAGAASTCKRPSKNKRCPCGSGRKYKQCCKIKELEAERKQASSNSTGTSKSAASKADLAARHLQTLDL